MKTESEKKEHSTIAVILPVFNEEDGIHKMMDLLKENEKRREDINWQYYLVNDGSTDKTKDKLEALYQKYNNITVVELSRNFGHQAAVTAGLNTAKGDYFAIMDSDCQDPPEVLLEMYDKLKEGNNIAYGKRKKRSGESWFKIITARYFYKTINWLSPIPIPTDTGDFRLFDKEVYNAIQKLPEYHKFLRGLFAWVGYKSVPVYYDRPARAAGESKYPFLKMLNFAKDAIFSFSRVPLQLANIMGLLITALGAIGNLAILYLLLVEKDYIPGVSAILFSVLLIGGVQLISIGIIGEYVGRIFEESKRRPLYIIDEVKNKEASHEKLRSIS